MAEVVFIGRPVYESRVIRDGYTFDDVASQIASGMESAAVVLKTNSMTAMENPAFRADRYGNSVRDRPELYSVVPKGDRTKPKSHPWSERPF